MGEIESFKDPWEPVSWSDHLHLDRRSESCVSWDESGILALSPYDDFERTPADRDTIDRSQGLTTLEGRISSQLLFFRLTTIFGAPMLSKCESEVDGCFSFGLRLHDKSGQLSIMDYMGSPIVRFEGTSEMSSAKALELLNYVTGKSCMNPNGMLLGGHLEWA